MADKIEFTADKVKIMGPKVDGGFVVSFDLGEYTYDQIKELPNLNGKIIKVSVEDKL